MNPLPHSEKIRLAGIKRHGSEEAWRKFMSDSSNKSRRNQAGTGGFAKMKLENPERLHQISTDAANTRHAKEA